MKLQFIITIIWTLKNAWHESNCVPRERINLASQVCDALGNVARHLESLNDLIRKNARLGITE